MTNHKDLSQFFVKGINYKSTDARLRAEYSVNSEQYVAALKIAADQGIRELFILSTCNRTEIYGFASSAEILVDVLCSVTRGNSATFNKISYCKNGMNAVEHLFLVGSGLDSQILGDYEIVGQLKKAVRVAKEAGFTGTVTERLVNHVLQASKMIKNQTNLSSGTVSVSFAAVKFLKQQVVSHSKKILVVGAGKIGSNTCKNLTDYLPGNKVTLINRSFEKAQKIADELGLRCDRFENIDHQIYEADIIIAATSSSSPIIKRQNILEGQHKLILDLSIPSNVEAGIAELPSVQLINVDELSKAKDETLNLRLAEVPKARAIIKTVMREFAEWHEMRKHVPMLQQLKIKLKQLYSDPSYFGPVTCTKKLDLEVQQVLNETALRLKMQKQKGCHYITALNEFTSIKS